jgi:hypothetical protein
MNIIKIDPDYFSETHSIGATSAQSSVIPTGSGIIRIAVRDTHAHIKFGINPTATDGDYMLPAGTVEYFAFVSGQKVAFIKAGDGNGEINICAIE